MASQFTSPFLTGKEEDPTYDYFQAGNVEDVLSLPGPVGMGQPSRTAPLVDPGVMGPPADLAPPPIEETPEQKKKRVLFKRFKERDPSEISRQTKVASIMNALFSGAAGAGDIAGRRPYGTTLPLYERLGKQIQQPLREQKAMEAEQSKLMAPKEVDADFALKLKSKFDADQRVKATRSIDMATSRMANAYDNYLKSPNKGANALDQALITLFNKVNDPGSVVRESEFNRFAQGLSLGSFVKGKGGKWTYGGAGLTDADRAQLVKYAALLSEGQNDAYQAAVDEYSLFSDKFNVPIEMVAGSGRQMIDPEGISVPDQPMQYKLKEGEEFKDVKGRMAVFNENKKFVGWADLLVKKKEKQSGE